MLGLKLNHFSKSGPWEWNVILSKILRRFTGFLKNPFAQRAIWSLNFYLPFFKWTLLSSHINKKALEIIWKFYDLQLILFISNNFWFPEQSDFRSYWVLQKKSEYELTGMIWKSYHIIFDIHSNDHLWNSSPFVQDSDKWSGISNAKYAEWMC